jgi:hypothetical protein
MGWAHKSPARFHLTAREGRPVLCVVPVPGGRAHCTESAQRRWPPVVAAPRGLAPLTTTPEVTEEAITHSALSPPLFGHAPRCSASRWPLLRCRCPSQMSCPELSDWTKRSASSPRPSDTRSLPAAPSSEAGPRDFPVVLFLRQHLTGGSLLRLFPHPAASSAPPRSSSPTSSLTTLTTPSAPHHCLLPIGMRATVESPRPGEHPLPDLPC